MNRSSGKLKKTVALLLFFGLFAACDQFEEDVMPVSFGADIRINPDDIYVYNNKTSRVHSEANDTVTSFTKKTYTAPRNGTLVPNFDGIEGTMGYRPNPGFVGVDSISYEVCSGQTCKTAKIRLIVEDPMDVTNCTTTVVADKITMKGNTSKEYRIHLNDIICPTNHITVSLGQPSHGSVRHYTYHEGWKNDVVVYTPDKGFRGQDTYTYKVYPNGYNGNSTDKFVETTVTITVE